MRELTPPSEQAKIGKRVSKSLNPIFQPDPNGFAGKEEVGRYICTICPDDREMPGFEGVVAKWDRNKHGERAKELPCFERSPFNAKKTFLTGKSTSLPYTDTQQLSIICRRK